jgi:uncharacterized membrane protein
MIVLYLIEPMEDPMNELYNTLVFIHILSAILGMGPGFTFLFILKTAKNMEQLRHAYLINHKLHNFVKFGGSLLLITGLLMGTINTGLFTAGWYITSLTLFLIALAMGPLVLSRKLKPVKEFLATYEGHEIPDEYHKLYKKVEPYEYLTLVVFLVIIILMILKPF